MQETSVQKKVEIGNCTLYLGDSLKILPELRPQLDPETLRVLIDPPYGINFGNYVRTFKDGKGNRYRSTEKSDAYHLSDWDKEFDFTPFFELLEPMCREMIVWGGNYFPCLWQAPAKGFIAWQKHQPVDNFSEGELAWSNIDMPAKVIDFPYYGGIEGKTKASQKFHPTQKPVKVMLDCLSYFKPEPPPSAILDCFMGSGTTGVACSFTGKKFIGIEMDPVYFEVACKRIADAQHDLFLGPAAPFWTKPEQTTLL